MKNPPSCAMGTGALGAASVAPCWDAALTPGPTIINAKRTALDARRCRRFKILTGRICRCFIAPPHMLGVRRGDLEHAKQIAILAKL
jgi:hypothetical protein